MNAQSLRDSWAKLNLRAKLLLVLAVVALVGLVLADLLDGHPGEAVGSPNAFFRDHGFVTGVLASFVLAALATFVFETIQAKGRELRLEQERERWQPLERLFLDDVLLVVERFHQGSELGAIEEVIDYYESEDPDDVLAREERDLDFEDAIVRGKSPTPGQYPPNARRAALAQHALVRECLSEVGRIAARWAALIGAYPDNMGRLLDLSGGLGQQRDILEEATEPGFDEYEAARAIVASQRTVEASVKQFITDYVSATGRSERSVQRIIELGRDEYVERKLAARDAIYFHDEGLRRRRPPSSDPDDDPIPF